MDERFVSTYPEARALMALSQTELARRVDVNRSAAAQWEHPAGTIPSVEHLIQVAVETGMTFEWIATGRGPNRSGLDMEPAVIVDDFAMDADESRALAHLRCLPATKRKSGQVFVRHSGECRESILTLLISQ